jgi:hypothetical protein
VAYEIIQIADAVVCVRIWDVMQMADLEALQTVAKELIEKGKKVRLLAILENFQGWEKGVDWGDVSFLMEQGNSIVKMAIVGKERWKDKVFLFVGKGLRTTI